MPVTVERVENEPVIIATIIGGLTEDIVLKIYSETAKLIENSPEEHFFRIADVRESDSTFVDIMAVIAKMRDRNLPGSPADPRITLLFLGTNQWMDIAIRAMHRPQNGNLWIPVFKDFDSVWEFIRHKQAESNGQQV